MSEISYKLPGFEGPLDLLLHLVRKHKLNIVDIPISDLLEQYMETINKWKEANLDIATEFLHMAAWLVQIKSSMLLPKHEEESDLRDELSGLLIEYQICQQMAKRLEKIFIGNDLYVREPLEITPDNTYRLTHSPQTLVEAYFSAAGRGMRKLPPPAAIFSPLVEREVIPVSTKIVYILRNIQKNSSMKYKALFQSAKSRSELVATFLAMLELIRNRRITVDLEEGSLTVNAVKGLSQDDLDIENSFDE